MAVDSGSGEGNNTMLAMIVGAVLVVAVILFALGTFGTNPIGSSEPTSKIEIQMPNPAPAPAPTTPTQP